MNQRPSPLAIVAIVALAAFTIFITWRAKRFEKNLLNRDEPSALISKPAPDFSLYSLDGRKVSLADYHGKTKLVITFWASWCGPCRMELPMLRDFYKRYRKNSDDFEILAIDVDDDRADAEAAAAKDRLPFPVLLDTAGVASDAYGVESIPAMFVIEKDGTVRDGRVGFDQTMEYHLVAALGIKTNNRAGANTDDDSSH
jgi:peroxiredoxin